jgi:probable phosphoglycerate mutase
VSLVVVRHAEQERDGQDGRLTARGRQQAATLSDALALTPADLVASSSRRRARETAAALGSAAEIAAEILDGLDEYRFGPDWTWQHADDREDLVLWRPEDRAGAESLAEFQARVDHTVESLVDRKPPGRIVMCVHSGVIDAILRWAFGSKPDTAWTTEAVVPHASITELRHWPTGRDVRGAPRYTVLVRVGDVGHLPADLVTGL